MRKRAISFILAGTMAATLAMTGCGSSGGSDSKKDGAEEKVKLRLMSISSDGNQTEILENYIKKNIETELPNVEVEFEPGGSGEDMNNKLKTYNASGDLPDVWYSTADSAVAILNAGNIQDLTEYVTEDKFIEKYNVPEALKHSDGGIYCLSSGADTYFTPRIFYNKQIFDKYGLSIPTTYEELLDVCKKLNENGEVPMSLAGKNGWAPQLFLMQTMIQMEDPQVALDLLSNKTDFSNPVVINAANRISEMVQEGCFPEGITSLAYSDAREMFTSGRAAMLAGWTWDIPTFEKDANIDMFAWPTAKEGNNVEDSLQFWGSPLNGYAVNPDSENVEMAVKLAEFCVEQEAKFYAEQGSMLNLNTGIASENQSEIMKKNMEMYEAAETKIPSIMLNCMDSKTSAEYASYGSELLTGEYSGEDYSKDFNQIWLENKWFD